MADDGQYLWVLAACLVVTAPLEVLFEARVYRRPARTLRALLPVVVAFYLWDVVAIHRGHWWFEERYVTGLRLPGDVPIEELAFFVVVPLCALLTYESVANLLDGRVGWVQRLLARRRAGRVSGPSATEARR